MNDAHDDITPSMKEHIDSLSRLEMARIWRFAEFGDPIFQGGAGQYFALRFMGLGGFSPEISKQLGWKRS